MSLKANTEIGLLKEREIIASFGELALRFNDFDEILTKACRLIKAGVGWKAGVVGQTTLKVEKPRQRATTLDGQASGRK